MREINQDLSHTMDSIESRLDSIMVTLEAIKFVLLEPTSALVVSISSTTTPCLRLIVGKYKNVVACLSSINPQLPIMHPTKSISTNLQKGANNPIQSNVRPQFKKLPRCEKFLIRSKAKRHPSTMLVGSCSKSMLSSPSHSSPILWSPDRSSCGNNDGEWMPLNRGRISPYLGRIMQPQWRDYFACLPRRDRVSSAYKLFYFYGEFHVKKVIELWETVISNL